MQDFEIQELIKQIYDNPELRKLISEQHYSPSDVEKNIMPFLAYLVSEQKCQKCQRLEECSQSQQGKKVKLKMMSNHFDPYFDSCDRLLLQESNKTHLIASGYNFDQVKRPEITNEREEILAKMKTIIKNVKNDSPTKGLYIYGAHGVGKTYLLAYLANELAKTKKKIIFIYFPDLVRKIKSSISNNSLEAVIDELKEVDILIMDDFGAETCSSFVRDEILGPILQDRMNNNLLTFMSSNLDDDDLIDHLSGNNDKSETIRATRIRSRMQALMDFEKLTGNNHRL